MKNKKIYILFLIIISIFITACRKEEVDNDYKIGFITDSEEFKNTRSGQISRVLNTIIENRKNVKLFEKIAEKDDDYITDIQSLIDKGCNLIIGNSFLLKEDFEILAPNNPEIEFLLFDAVTDPEIENIKSVSFKVNESSYLVGYLAGLETKTNVLGYIGYESGLISDMYEYGFRAGVADAADELHKKIEIHIKRVNSMSDFNQGKKLANEMYDNNVDIIYQTVGYTGLGVIESAKHNDKFVIGYDIDQSYIAPDNILISSVKNYDMITAQLVEKYILNTKESEQNLFYGIKEGGVSAKTISDNKNFKSENYQKMTEKENKIINHEIDIPLNKDTFMKYEVQ